MKDFTLPLAEQRQLLRLQLHQQRRLIAAQLEPKPELETSYPRSMIMRFLTQQHGARMLGEMAAVMLGTRWLKSRFSRTLVKAASSLLPGKLKPQ